MDSTKSLKSTPIPEFANFVVEQFDGNFDHVVTYLETVMLCVQDVKLRRHPISGFVHSMDAPSIQPSTDAVAELNENFLSDNTNFVLKYGKKKQDFMGGLEAYIGRPKNPDILREMELEHYNEGISETEFSPSNNQGLITTPAEEWLFVMEPRAYIQLANAKGRLVLPRMQTSIAELMSHDIRFKADLTEAEVVAARLYTGPMFKLYNDVLRNPPGPGHTSFVYTIHAFASCVVKLARVHRVTTLYRGIKGGALPQTFLTPDEYGCCGGVEYGFMSTTTVKGVAHDYAQGKGTAAAVIYEIDEGSIDRGADVSWLSQFPRENEVVFPPLTNLEVVGKAKIVDGTIVTKLRVNINLRTLTVDEVIAKSRKQFMDMMEWYFDEAKTAELGFDPSHVFPGWLEDFSEFKEAMGKVYDPRVFNQHTRFYRKAVDDALDLKEGTIQKVCVLRLLKSLLPPSTASTLTSPQPAVAVFGVHNLASMQRLILRLEATHASKFADPNFLMRYVTVKAGEVGKDGQAALANYEQLWKLPLQKGSWAQLLRETHSVPPIRISVRRSCAQYVRDFFYQFAFVKGTARQLVGFQALDALLGIDGNYYYVGMENGKPFYQLSKKESSLSSKYLYFCKSHWFIGSTLGSEVAHLRSSTQNDATPADVKSWEKTSALLLMTFIVSSCSYTSDGSVKSSPLEKGFGVNFDFDQKTGSVSNALFSGSFNDAEPRCQSAAYEQSPMDLNPTEGVTAGEQWAFVHRMIEEDDHGLGTFSQSELHSIAVFCQHTDCPIPKTVSSCLLRESSTARLAAVCCFFAILTSIYINIGFALWVVFMGLGTADDSLLFPIAWFTKGLVFEICLVGFLSLSSLAGALNGFSYKSVKAILAAATFWGGVIAADWIFVSPSDQYGFSSGIAFHWPGCPFVY